MALFEIIYKPHCEMNNYDSQVCPTLIKGVEHFTKLHFAKFKIIK